MTEPALIPRPARLTAGSGYLRVGDRTEILADAESHAAAALLAALLPPVAGEFRVRWVGPAASRGTTR